MEYRITVPNIGFHQWLGLGPIGKLIGQIFFFFKAFFLSKFSVYLLTSVFKKATECKPRDVSCKH